MQQKISFEGRQGQTIAGVIHSPEFGSIKAYALFAHCFTCTKNINSAVHIAKALAEEGIATLRFDFTGLGSSSGDFADTSFSTNVQDLVDAASFLQQEYQAPQILIGHSLGGTAMLAASHHINSAKAIATIGSPASPEHVLHHLQSKIETIGECGQADVELAGRTFTFKQEFIDDIESQKIDLRHLGKALMVMHSPIDDTVDIDQAEKIYTQALHPKSFITLDDADHLLSRSSDSQYAGRVLASWANRYIEQTTDASKDDHSYPKKNSVVISANSDLGFLNHINSSGHKFIADEPLSYGGTNLGPSPYDYLSAALGACTAMTLNMYAKRKGIKLDNVTVEVEHNKIHAEDCETCATKNGKVDQFKRQIKLKGDLTDAEQARMLQIADMCPVHKTLHSETQITSQWLED